MSWYALEEIDEAINETKSLLMPFDLATWSKLALIVLLTGSGFSMPNFGGSYNSPSSGEIQGYEGELQGTNLPQSTFNSNYQTASPPAISELIGGIGISQTILMAFVALFFLVGLPLMFVSSVFEFIFYQSLIDKNVKIRKNFKRHLGRGARYFGFQIAYILFLLVLIAAAAWAATTADIMILLLLLAFIPVILVLGIFTTLTHDFILVRMMEKEQGLIEAWRSFWPTLKQEWKQVVVYLVVKFFIGLIVSVGVGMIILVVTMVLAIPFVLVAAILGIISITLVIIPAFIGILVWLVMVLYISVPFQVFVYYYIILVYHDITA